jgi:hypothetical protein
MPQWLDEVNKLPTLSPVITAAKRLSLPPELFELCPVLANLVHHEGVLKREGMMAFLTHTADVKSRIAPVTDLMQRLRDEIAAALHVISIQMIRDSEDQTLTKDMMSDYEPSSHQSSATGGEKLDCTANAPISTFDTSLQPPTPDLKLADLAVSSQEVRPNIYRIDGSSIHIEYVCSDGAPEVYDGQLTREFKYIFSLINNEGKFFNAVDLIRGLGSTSQSIAAGYHNDELESLPTRRSWTMQKTQEQFETNIKPSLEERIAKIEHMRYNHNTEVDETEIGLGYFISVLSEDVSDYTKREILKGFIDCKGKDLEPLRKVILDLTRRDFRDINNDDLVNEKARKSVGNAIKRAIKELKKRFEIGKESELVKFLEKSIENPSSRDSIRYSPSTNPPPKWQF